MWGSIAQWYCYAGQPEENSDKLPSSLQVPPEIPIKSIRCTPHYFISNTLLELEVEFNIEPPNRAILGEAEIVRRLVRHNQPVPERMAQRYQASQALPRFSHLDVGDDLIY